MLWHCLLPKAERLSQGQPASFVPKAGLELTIKPDALATTPHCFSCLYWLPRNTSDASLPGIFLINTPASAQLNISLVFCFEMPYVLMMLYRKQINAVNIYSLLAWHVFAL